MPEPVVDRRFRVHESEFPVLDWLHCAMDWNEQFTSAPAERSFRHHFPFDPAALADAVKAQSAVAITRAYRMEISVG
jgi:hypothetical protein